MYHGLHTGIRPGKWKWSVPVDRFRKQMLFLASGGWTTFCISDLKHVYDLPPCSVAITFDDGFRDNYDLALPVIVELGLCATWFIVSRDIGKRAGWSHPSPYNNHLLDSGQIRRMAASGMEIGAHSRTHSDLTMFSEKELRDEIAGSKRDIENITGSGISSFAYPFGRWNDLVLKITAEAGYQFACTTSTGRVCHTVNSMLVPRVAVFADDTTSSFARKLVYASTRVEWEQIIKNKIAGLAGKVKRSLK
jgi:peptidoglycan/xylan/chitin deacetylase (PgdA/CDA1 family)